jgi:hypothetical protein
MEQWDYLEAYVYQDEWVDTSGRRARLGQKLKVRDTVVYFSSADLLQNLGAEGWELVNVAYVDMTLYRMFLKRRRGAIGSEDDPEQNEKTEEMELCLAAG